MYKFSNWKRNLADVIFYKYSTVIYPQQDQSLSGLMKPDLYFDKK